MSEGVAVCMDEGRHPPPGERMLPGRSAYAVEIAEAFSSSAYPPGVVTGPPMGPPVSTGLVPCASDYTDSYNRLYRIIKILRVAMTLSITVELVVGAAGGVVKGGVAERRGVPGREGGRQGVVSVESGGRWRECRG